MNSMNDSGEFQEVGSNHSGRVYYVPSQPAAIPSSRSIVDDWEACNTQSGGVSVKW